MKCTWVFCFTGFGAPDFSILSANRKCDSEKEAWRQVTDYFNTAHIPIPNPAIKLGILNNLYTYAPGNKAPLVKVLLFVQTLPLVK